MKFKDYIKESIIDIPRRRYAPGVFDDADSNNPKLKKKVVDCEAKWGTNVKKHIAQ